MILVTANQATASKRRVYFFCKDAADFNTPETGESGGQPQVSVDGATWTDTGIGTLVSVGNGRYYAELTQALIATAGVIVSTRYKSSNTSETEGTTVQVIGVNLETATQPVNITQIDGLATNDNLATLKLKHLSVVNSEGDAVVASSTGGNGQGVNASGNGTGAGVKATGGATGSGTHCLGGSTSGSGLKVAGQSGSSAAVGLEAIGTYGGSAIKATAAAGSGIGIEAVGSGHGISSTGGSSGINASGAGGASQGGIRSVGSSSNTPGVYIQGNGSGAGINTSSASSGNGILSTGAGAGAGVRAVGGATGSGLECKGGATYGCGIDAAAAGAGNSPTDQCGIRAVAGATGDGLRAAGGAGGAGGKGIAATAGAGNQPGIATTGMGTGSGVQATGGASGTGISAQGSASGAGFAATGGTSGNGVTFTGGGAGAGLKAQGGDSGSGGAFSGGATQGQGIAATAQGIGSGAYFSGGSTGNGITALCNAVDGNGIQTTGVGGGHGLLATAGATGDGIKASTTAGAEIRGSVTGSLSGDVGGKVLGGGSGVMAAVGVRAVDASGNDVAPASTAVSNVDLTPSRAALLDRLDAAISSRAAASDVAAAEAAIRGVDSDTLKTLSDQIDGVGGGSTPVGSRSVSFVVESESGVRVSDVAITVLDDSGTNVLWTGRSAANGLAGPVAIEDGSYLVRKVKAGVVFVEPETVEVTSDEVFTVVGEVWQPTPPSSAQMCVIYDWILNAAGQPVAGASVKINAVVPGSAGGHQLGNAIIDYTTGEDGYVEFELMRGAKVSVMAQAIGFEDAKKTVPDVQSLQLSSW